MNATPMEVAALYEVIEELDRGWKACLLAAFIASCILTLSAV
jgi:hypothetical protein